MLKSSCASLRSEQLLDLAAHPRHRAQRGDRHVPELVVQLGHRLEELEQLLEALAGIAVSRSGAIELVESLPQRLERRIDLPALALVDDRAEQLPDVPG